MDRASLALAVRQMGLCPLCQQVLIAGAGYGRAAQVSGSTAEPSGACLSRVRRETHVFEGVGPGDGFRLPDCTGTTAELGQPSD
ncbi:hypothetical protein SSCG_02237 [Streptomyces clavuligerus]|nr:hypothetical protein SSCG_02237 [Streptomyces clavuligerus]